MSVSLHYTYISMHFTYISQLEQTCRQVFPNSSPFFFPQHYCYIRHLCPHACLPKLGSQVLLGMVIMDVPGILEQIAYRSSLHRDMSVVLQSLTDCQEGQLPYISHTSALRTPVVHSSADLLEQVTDFLVHVATRCYLVLKHVW